MLCPLMKDGLIIGAIIKKTPTSILEVGAKLMLYFIMNLHVENKIINFLICAVIFYRFVTIFLQK